MTFRDREKIRLIGLKPSLFSEAACESPSYHGHPYAFCLAAGRTAENLHESIRGAALGYFAERFVRWYHQAWAEYMRRRYEGMS